MCWRRAASTDSRDPISFNAATAQYVDPPCASSPEGVITGSATHFSPSCNKHTRRQAEPAFVSLAGEDVSHRPAGMRSGKGNFTRHLSRSMLEKSRSMKQMAAAQ
eukprot:763929-Hanusia_phi.AAC.8